MQLRPGPESSRPLCRLLRSASQPRGPKSARAEESHARTRCAEDRQAAEVRSLALCDLRVRELPLGRLRSVPIGGADQDGGDHLAGLVRRIQIVALSDVCGRKPTPPRFQRSCRHNGLLTDLTRGTLSAVQGIRLNLRPLYTIVALLLTAAALLLMAQPRAVAGTGTQAAHAMAHAQHATTDSAPRESGWQGVSTPCAHGHSDQGPCRNPRLPCCNVPATVGRQPEARWIPAREARPLDPVRVIVEARVPPAHLRGIERPPKQG